MPPSKTFRYVDYLWDENRAREFEGDEVALLLYRSNLLGADLRITNYGGGNTSCKTLETHPLTGEPVEVMWIKGSGGDLGTLTRQGLAGLYTHRLRALEGRYRGPEHEDEMVALLRHCLFDPDSRTPSIDTPLHGLLPFKHIDHLHPDAVIAIAAAKDSRELTRRIWGESMGWVPWRRPGFELALQLRRCVEENPGIRGIVLAGHGLFTWGESSHACYQNSLEVIEAAGAFLAAREGRSRPVFGGAKLEPLPPAERRRYAASLMPTLRGLCSSEQRMVGHFTDDERLLQFVNSHDLERLAPLGTSCPDHFLRTKIQPLVLSLPPDWEPPNPEPLRPHLEPLFEDYRAAYRAYYESCRHPDSPPMRDPNPVVLLLPRVGMFTFAKDKKTARIAAEFYLNAVNVMRGSEAVSEYTALPRQEAFDIEYWWLEENKLRRQPPEKPLSRRVALVTGAGGGIGGAIARKLVAEGAQVVLLDLYETRLQEAMEHFSPDEARALPCDVRKPAELEAAFVEACRCFGGVDILVHSAGLAVSKPLEATTIDDWRVLQEVLVQGQFLLARQAADIMRRQGFGGDMIFIASKNGLTAGPNNVAYGTAKAAQLHMTRLLAAELAADGIRVNAVNPDGVVLGSKIWEGAWAEGRARAYGIRVEDLPEFYAQRNLLKQAIRPEDVAEAVFAFLALLPKTTGQMLNVDGGMPAAFVR